MSKNSARARELQDAKNVHSADDRADSEEKNQLLLHRPSETRFLAGHFTADILLTDGRALCEKVRRVSFSLSSFTRRLSCSGTSLQQSERRLLQWPQSPSIDGIIKVAE